MARWIVGVFFVGSLFVAPPIAAQSGAPNYSESLVQQAVQTLLPSGAYVSKFTVNSDRVRLDGSAENNTQVSEFMRKIAGSTDFREVELEQIGASSTGVSFVMHLKIACSQAPKSSDRVLCGRTPPKAQAIYKCRINGSVSFQNKPCPAGSEL